MDETKKDNRKKRKVLKRILQFSLLFLLVAALGVAVYAAVAATRLVKLRASQAAKKASRDAAAAEARSLEEASRSLEELTRETEEGGPKEETVSEVPTEPETETEDSGGFSIVDLFDPTLFDEPGDDAEASNYAELVQDYAGEKRIWMGDSRFVGLSRAIRHGENDVFISKGAMSYDWFSTEGLSQLMQELAKDPERIVIINFGLNDCANNCAGWDAYFVEDYVDTINRLTSLYPDTRFFFASVGLINGDYERGAGRGTLPQNQVCDYVDVFNYTMYSECIAEYIDLSEYLVRDGYKTVDGVHYDAATCEKIYNYCVVKAGKYK